VSARKADAAISPKQQMPSTRPILYQEGFSRVAKLASCNENARIKVTGTLQKACHSAEQQDQAFGKTVRRLSE